jgi:addiction module HigA family antidote
MSNARRKPFYATSIRGYHWKGTAMAMKPPHPGGTIREEYLIPLGMSVNALAKALRISPTRLNDIVRGRRRITADSALRLARYFGTTPDLWMNLQSFYDLRMAQREDGKTIARQVRPRAAAGAVAPAPARGLQ